MMTLHRAENVVAKREGGKTLLLHPTSGRFCILNETSTFIWEHCTDGRTTGEIGELLSAHFELPADYAEPAQLEGMVERHLRLLQKADFLTAAD